MEDFIAKLDVDEAPPLSEETSSPRGLHSRAGLAPRPLTAGAAPGHSAGGLGEVLDYPAKLLGGGEVDVFHVLERLGRVTRGPSRRAGRR